MEQKIMDGNSACSYVSYNFTEVAGIYPITPASTMAEKVDEYSASGKTNMFGDVVKVVEMQSEAGAIGMVHGLLQNGVLATTYTASQGLLLMIPNMYKIAGELLPCVINVAARTVATHALSIMGDHSDIYSTRQTGFAILASSSVQQVMDLTGVSYLSAIKGRVPFINFFDGFRTSHEYNKINVIDNEIFKELIDYKALENFRKNALDIDNPTTRGTNQGDMVYFEAVEARNKYYEKLPDIVNDYMEKINKKINTNEKRYGSFLLRYLRVENLVFSSGERAFQNLMSWIYYLGNLDEYVTRKQDQARENIIVCIDEIDLCMHPAWQRDLIWNVINLVNSCYKGKHIQIIMTTHSPLCLSDVPRDNIIYMKKTEEGSFIDDSEHKETFGANIYEILDDAFYLENKSMGSFALNFIKNLIAEIDQRSEVSDKEYDEYKQKICYIGDSLIRNKLKAKLKSKRRVNKEVEIAEIDKKIDELNKRRKMIMETSYEKSTIN